MTQTRDVLSQEPAAQAIIDFFLTYANEQEKAERLVTIDNLLDEVEKEYSGRDDATWFGAFKRTFVYPMSRGRQSELTAAVAALKKCSDTVPRLAIIGDLLKADGGVESTSAHTLILDKLLVLAKFNSLLADATSHEKTKQDVRNKLKQELTVKIDKKVSDYEDAHRQKRQQELAAVRPIARLKVDASAMKDIQAVLTKHLKGETIAGEVTKRRLVMDVKPLDKSLLAQRGEMLSKVFAAKPVAVRNKSMKSESDGLKTSPKFASAFATINSLFTGRLAQTKVEHGTKSAPLFPNSGLK